MVVVVELFVSVEFNVVVVVEVELLWDDEVREEEDDEVVLELEFDVVDVEEVDDAEDVVELFEVEVSLVKVEVVVIVVVVVDSEDVLELVGRLPVAITETVPDPKLATYRSALVGS